MKTYMANALVTEMDEGMDLYVVVEFEAEDDDQAREFAEEADWDYLGEKGSLEACAAVLEAWLDEPTIH